MWLILLLVLPFFILRGLRWLAIVQQKEYRLDRLLIFLHSRTGQKDFWILWPPKNWLSRTGLKRPVRTNRILVVLVCLLMILSVIFWLVSNLSWWLIGLVVFISYIALPWIIIFCLAPTVLVAQVVTNITLQQAKQKLIHGKPLVIGLTGSYGKTSTKLLVAHLLASKYSVFVTPKSHNTRYSVAKAILNHYRNQKIAVIEYAAYTQGEIKTLASWFAPHLAVITGLAPQHLELFKTLENIILAKAELIKALPNNAPVFCNAADQGAVKICQVGQAQQIINYSGEKSVVELKHVGLTNQGRLTFVWRGHTIVTKLIGLHYQENVAGAIAVAEHLDVSELDIVTALQSFQPTAAFTQLIAGKNNSTIVDDGGTTNPIGFISALNLIKNFKTQKYKTILITAGIIDLGPKSKTIHHDLAIKARSVINEVWYVGEEGLSEFKQQFDSDLFFQKNEILQQVKTIDQNTALLIEGRLPQWLKVIYANL